MVKNAWNALSLTALRLELRPDIDFDHRECVGWEYWLPVSNATVQIISNIENHVFETKLLYIFIKSNCKETISLLFMVPNIWNYLSSCIWTGQYSQPSHSRWPNSMSGCGLSLKYYTDKVSCISDHEKSNIIQTDITCRN